MNQKSTDWLRDLSICDTPLDQWIHRPPARLLARFFSRTPLTPNHVTLITLVPAFLSAVFFSLGNFICSTTGLVFFYLWAVLDHADGELARMKNCSSALGQKLDDLFDHVASVAIYLGLFLGMLPFWDKKDGALLSSLFIGAVFLNVLGAALLSKAKRTVRDEAFQNKTADETFARYQKTLDFFTGRDLFYLLNILILSAHFFGGVFWFSFVMGSMIIGLYVLSAGFLIAWFRMKKYNHPSDEKSSHPTTA